MEAILRELLQHTYGVGEAVFRKLIVTLPVDTEPAGVEVDDVRRYLVCSELLGDIKAFLLREIGDTAHPSAEAPKGQHWRLARDIRILVEDILRLTEEYKEVHLLIAHEDAVGTDIRGPEVAGHRC